tara:strand:+ start:8039 stop:8974 length:936 start_codon:yes stop_codon:yes gene_type:complete
MNKYIAILSLLILTACGNSIESAEIPTDEHPMAYHLEFYQRIEKELPIKDAKLLKKYVRRIGEKNIESGTDIEDAIDAQKEYEIEKEKQRIAERKAKRAEQLKKYKTSLAEFKKEVKEANSIFNFNTEDDFKKYISEKIQVSLTPLALKKRYCRKCFKYNVGFEAKVIDDLGVSIIDLEYYNKLNEKPKIYESRWKMRNFNKTQKDNKFIYTSKKDLFEIKSSNALTVDDIKKKNDIEVSIKKVYIGGDLFKDPELFTLDSAKSYLARLNLRLKKIELEIQSVESDESKLFKYDFLKGFTKAWRSGYADAA